MQIVLLGGYPSQASKSSTPIEVFGDLNAPDPIPVFDSSLVNYTEAPDMPGRIFVPSSDLGQSWRAWKGIDCE
jgi:hypothetical protein